MASTTTTSGRPVPYGPIWNDWREGRVVPFLGAGASETPIHTLRHKNIVSQVAYSPVGNYLATSSWDRTARVWNAEDGKEVFRFTHPRGVEGVAFSPDGKRLATAGHDSVVRVFLLDLPELTHLARSRLTRPWTDDECQEYLHQRPCPSDLPRPAEP